MLLLPFQWFRAFHMAHHRHTNDPERDPSLRAHGPTQRFLIHVSGLPYWWAMARVLIENAFGKPDADYLPERIKPAIRKEAKAYLVIYIALALLLGPWLIWLWVLPARPAVPAPIPPRGTWPLPARGQYAREFPHDFHQPCRALSGVEHALPCGASRLPGGAVPPASCLPCPRQRPPEVHVPGVREFVDNYVGEFPNNA